MSELSSWCGYRGKGHVMEAYNPKRVGSLFALCVAVAFVESLHEAHGQPCGPSWSSSFSASDVVRTLVVFDEDGDGPGRPSLFMGGHFTLVGGVPIDRIARWNGTSWSSVGGGTNATVTDLVVHDSDGDGPIRPTLIAAGSFTTAGGVNANHIAQWDGISWSPLGSGFCCTIYAMASFDDDGPGPNAPALYIGTAPFMLRKWDGSTWSTITGLTGGTHVAALGVFDEDAEGPGLPALYVGGNFTSAGGTIANRVAKWDGQVWSPLGDGLGPVNVFAFATFDDDGPGPIQPALYVGGAFSTAGGAAARNLARWDGTQWSSVGGGYLGIAVYSLQVHDDDGVGPSLPGLYVGGWFDSVSGLQVGHIAKWDGASWSGLDNGVWHFEWPAVNALAVFDDDGLGPYPAALYAGGYFNSPAHFITRWRRGPDNDADGTEELCDNCPGQFNVDQAEGDGDGIGDACDPCPLDNPDDTDGDGVCNFTDPCAGFPNSDSDDDGICDSGDPCSGFPNVDADSDGVCNSGDVCAGFPNVDSDGDGLCDLADLCSGFPNVDADSDGVCDAADPCPQDNPDDTDGDGICDNNDRCPGDDDTLDADGNGTPDCLELGIPTVSTWGLVVLALLLLTAWKLNYGRACALKKVSG